MADLESIPVTISAESLRALMADALELQDERRANSQLAEHNESQRRRVIGLLTEKDTLRQQLFARAVSYSRSYPTFNEWQAILSGLPEVRQAATSISDREWLRIVYGIRILFHDYPSANPAYPTKGEWDRIVLACPLAK